MKRTLSLFVLLMLFFMPSSFAEIRGAELIPADSWIYDALRYLSVDTGQTTLAVNSPASVNEFRIYLGAIPYESLGVQGQNLYRKIQDSLGSTEPLWTSGLASLDFNPVVSVTGRSTLDENAYFGFESIENYNETAPLLSVPLRLGFTPFVSAFADFSLGEGYWASLINGNYSNIPVSADDIDLNVPSRAYLSCGTDFFTAVVGRGSPQISRTLNDSMILSGTQDRTNYSSFVFFSPAIRLSITPVELANDRWVYFHDLTIRPLPNLTLCFSEAASVNSTIDVRYLNPAMIFHSYAGWRDDYGQADGYSPVGTQFALSADFVPAPGYRIYGQFVMNQFQTSYELETYSSTAGAIPNSLGGLAGIEAIRPFRNGYLTGSIEGVYSNPWLYMLSNHDISFYWYRRELMAPSGYASKKIEGWLGSPYGPDTIACLARAVYDVPQSHTMGFEYRFIYKGDNETDFLESSADDYYPDTLTEAARGNPTGTHRTQNSLSLFGMVRIDSHLVIDGKLGYSLMDDGQLTPSVNARCSMTWSLR